MAKAKKTKQQSTSEKLRSLYEMQAIDKEYDRIQRLKGELPLEVEEQLKNRRSFKTAVRSYSNAIIKHTSCVALCKQPTEQTAACLCEPP